MRAVLAILLILLFASCGKREKETTTGSVVAAKSLPLKGHVGDNAYAVVRTDALPAIYQDFRNELSRLGIVKADDKRYDCNKFASLYIAIAQTRYAVDAFHSNTGAMSLAMAEVWHRKEPGAHALVAVVTDRGLVFVEPQTGAEVSVSLSTIYFVKW